ncbi:MAG: SDR family oxidoreductase, partial [Paracoccaceae bacterium]
SMTEVKRALVTGAAARVGRAMALDLAASGWDVAVHYNGSAEAAADVAGDITGMGRRAVTLQADLGDNAVVSQLVGRAADGLGGPISLLINNASTFDYDTLGTITDDSWEAAQASNLRAPVLLTQAFAAQAPKALPDARGEPVAQSVVVNLIDQRMLKTTPMFMSYTLAKSALLTFTRTSAQALAPHVRVGAIGPGPTLAATNQTDEHFARQRAACVLGRGSDPEDIVHALRFIIGNKAFTGQMLAIDGGQHLAWQTPDVVGTGE